jgi:hypothetical protein
MLLATASYSPGLPSQVFTVVIFQIMSSFEFLHRTVCFIYSDVSRKLIAYILKLTELFQVNAKVLWLKKLRQLYRMI